MSEAGNCPICEKGFPLGEIEAHVNKCIFLNSVDFGGEPGWKRKRSPSPLLLAAEARNPSLKESQPEPFSPPKRPKNPSKEPNNAFMKLASSSTASAATTRHSGGAAKETALKQEEARDMTFAVPLAQQFRPRSLDDFIGQSHILRKDSVLKALLEKGDVPNMILWGPPGCGKTSLAGVIRNICRRTPERLTFVSLSAATCGVKDVQGVIDAAKGKRRFGKRTVLFLDEIHRFNKKQQDSLLLNVETGDITLIGATTENPSFMVIKALLSRCRVVVMNKLDSADLSEILRRAAKNFSVHVECNGDDGSECSQVDSSRITVTEEVLGWLADISDGDARIALTNLQLLIQSNDPCKTVTLDNVKEKLKASHMLYDRKGEEHYNVISAMHKSIRGSDVNAALYWTTRMIVSGEDPIFIARRMVRAASEDIGNADPHALPLAVSTMQGCQLLGMPECDVLLAQCAIYLARAPKSREADSALAKAKSAIANCKGPQPSVPLHLRNAPTQLMKDVGYGQLAEGQAFTFMPPELARLRFLPQ